MILDDDSSSAEDVELNKGNLRDLLRRELSGFQRPERLDVKKPGPLFMTNNFIVKTETPIGMKKSLMKIDFQFIDFSFCRTSTNQTNREPQ